MGATTISTMSDDLEKSIKPEELLTASNYCSWAQNTAAKLRSWGLYRIISGKWTTPSPLPTGASAEAILAHDKLTAEYEAAVEKAAGLIYLLWRVYTLYKSEKRQKRLRKCCSWVKLQLACTG